MKKSVKGIITILLIVVLIVIFSDVSAKKECGNIDIDNYFSQLETRNSNDLTRILEDININLENKELDSHERGLNLLGLVMYNFKAKNINIVLDKFDEVENYLEKNNMSKELLMLYELICEYYTGSEKYDRVYMYIYKGEKIAAELYLEERNDENLSELLAIRYLKAVVAMELGMEEEADSAFLKAKRIEEKKLVAKRVDINYSKLIYYYKKGNYEKVKEHSIKVLEIINYNEKNKEYMDIYLNANIMLAESYLEENEVDEYNKIVERIDENSEDLKKGIQSKIYILKSKIHIYNNDIDNALIYLEKAYYEIESYNLSIREMEIIDNIVDLYEEKNDVDNIIIWNKRFRETIYEINKVSEYQELFSSIINTDLLEANYNVEILELRSKNLKYLLLIIILVVSIALKKIFSTIKSKNIKNDILNNNLNLLNKQLMYQYNHYESIKEHQLVVKRIWHDIKNHNIVLFGLLDNKKCEEAKLYLESLNKEFIPSEIQCISKNNIIDAIFCNKLKVCNEKSIDISLDIKIPENLNIDNFDLCAIFGNLLDNSIEACEKIYDTNMKKYIKVVSFIKNEHLYIKIENSNNEEILKSKGKIITSKKDKLFHGLGIENIERSVEKYSGIKKIVTEKNKFSVSILLKNQIV